MVRRRVRVEAQGVAAPLVGVAPGRRQRPASDHVRSGGGRGEGHPPSLRPQAARGVDPPPRPRCGKPAARPRDATDAGGGPGVEAGGMTHSAPVRVLVAGGGVAGLETVLALRALAGPRVALTLLAAEPEFVVRAAAVGEPFDRSVGRRLSLADFAAEHEATLLPGRLLAVEPEAHVAVTD